jgi:predicted negative regulator of RcsB-dependent stress response
LSKPQEYYISMQTEDDQLAQLKDWWQRNGKPLVFGAIVALAAVTGWQAWQKHKSNQAQGASYVYQQLVEAALAPSGQPDVAKVTALSSELKDNYEGTAYQQYGSLFIAKVAVDEGKFDDAAAELQSVVDKPVNEELGELARQRLARVLSAKGQIEEALKLLDGNAPKAFVAGREELRGDLLVRLNRSDDAYTAYQKARESLADEAAVGSLQMKLDDLAKGDA